MSQKSGRRDNWELTMSNCYASEVPPDSKRRKKTKETTTSWSMLPDEIALICLAHVSRFDHAALSLVSKIHRAMVASSRLFNLRQEMGCTDVSMYVCMKVFPNPTPRWFILTPNRRLNPIPSNPYQVPDSSSFVVVDGGIFVIGGLINGIPTSDVSFLDCYCHTWHRIKSMNRPRASASACFVDGKIYVFGGSENCAHEDTWAELFDPETQTWAPLLCLRKDWDFETPEYKNIYQSVVIEGQKIFGLDEKGQGFYFLSSDQIGNRNDWCIIDKLFYCHGTRGKILWCQPDDLDWKEVKGLEKLQHSLSSSRNSFNINKLCSNSAGNIVIFWIGQSLDLCSAEISVERRNGGEIWGKIEWSGVAFEVDSLLHSSYGFKVLFSASVYV
ncbi:Kelch repeat type 1 [Arabidopsis suecica]|uniref:Kelch repeat type 1 n=1 Tax=Arabidopsis suecica TaxID=45249 RepID=A0A8T1YKZ3_ARASU|nr:Kelch repeat type 1 [Arabidopsis suecica]